MNVKCNKCKWVHFVVSRNHAEDEVAKFNLFYNGLSDGRKENYNGPSKIENYEGCMLCGNNYKNFIDAEEKDVPMGATLNPILDRND